jgi:hypothetical protein
MRNSRPVWGLDFATIYFGLLGFDVESRLGNSIGQLLVWFQVGLPLGYLSELKCELRQTGVKKTTNPTHNQGVWFYLVLVGVIKPRGVISDSILLNPPLIVETTILTQEFVVIKFVTLMLGNQMQAHDFVNSFCHNLNAGSGKELKGQRVICAH